MSLYADFLAAVDKAATQQRCKRGFHHPPHDLDTGHRCPGLHTPTLPADQVRALADTARKEINKP